MSSFQKKLSMLDCSKILDGFVKGARANGVKGLHVVAYPKAEAH
jgi:hypothetical protein